MPFKTHDLGQAAFLVAKGYELTHLETDAGGRSAFVFGPEAIQGADSSVRLMLVSSRAWSTGGCHDDEDHLA
jgi:hypothetical protein